MSRGLDLDARLSELGTLLDAWLRAMVAEHLSPPGAHLAALLEYHLGWRDANLQPLETPAPAGKKLRPALVLLVSQAAAAEISSHVYCDPDEISPAARRAALAVELLHNFSLVHDDIQDRSALRRHRPTVWSVWGMPQAINVGDALFALAQVVLLQHDAGADGAAAQPGADLASAQLAAGAAAGAPPGTSVSAAQPGAGAGGAQPGADRPAEQPGTTRAAALQASAQQANPAQTNPAQTNPAQTTAAQTNAAQTNPSQGNAPQANPPTNPAQPQASAQQANTPTNPQQTNPAQPNPPQTNPAAPSPAQPQPGPPHQTAHPAHTPPEPVPQQDALAARMALELNRTALALAEGQFLDIDLQEGRAPPTLQTYEAMVVRKTGALFACACRLGAMAAGASPATCQTYAAYGLELGIAFQEQDDLLGVWGASSETGKPDAADIVERKRGLPAAIALSQPDAPEWLRRMYDTHDLEADDATIERVIAHFDALGVRATIERRVEARYRAALDHLAHAGAREPARAYLAAICEALVSRRT